MVRENPKLLLPLLFLDPPDRLTAVTHAVGDTSVSSIKLLL